MPATANTCGTAVDWDNPGRADPEWSDPEDEPLEYPDDPDDPDLLPDEADDYPPGTAPEEDALTVR